MSEKRGLVRSTLAYGLLLAAALAAVAAIERAGAGLAAPAAAGPSPALTGVALRSDALYHLLLLLAAVVAVGKLLGWALSRAGQPPVIGEVLGGILLGPSLLGRVWPAAGAYLLPESVAPALGLIAQLGVILYMFLVGLDLNTAQLKDRARATLAISHASIAVPFVLGCLLALWLYPRYGAAHVGFSAFSLFLGVAMSVTAFPVLARILTDQGLSNTALGATALACAAVDDATAWTLLALVVGLTEADQSSALRVAVLAAAFAALLLLALRPALGRRLSARAGPVSEATVTLVVLGVLLSALATQTIGIHAIFGAFLLGAVFPRQSAVTRSLKSRLEGIVSTLLLPAFFAYAGMRTRLDLVHGAEAWLACALIILVATLGKFGGAFLAAWLSGVPSREAAALGALMNTRGLVELVVLNIGMDLSIITPTVFAMMVIMALVTTLATAPALALIRPRTRVSTASARPYSVVSGPPGGQR